MKGNKVDNVHCLALNGIKSVQYNKITFHELVMFACFIRVATAIEIKSKCPRMVNMKYDLRLTFVPKVF